MTTGSENFGNGAAKTDDRFASPLSGYRPGQRRDSSVVLPIDGTASDDITSRNGSMFSTDSWLDSPTGSMVDHPLLRGLLLELPPKGSVPPQEWLDRWFEAARSILELLYAQSAGRA